MERSRLLTQKRERDSLPVDPAAEFTLRNDITGLDLQYNGQKIRLTYSEKDLGRALFISINLQRWDDVKTLLNHYRDLPNKKNTIENFATASLLQAEGYFSEAKTMYLMVLEEDPNFSRASLDLAQLLFLDREDKESKELFERLLNNRSIPSDIIPRINSYAEALNQRDQWNGYFSAGLRYNNNINQAHGGSITEIIIDPLQPGYIEVTRTLPNPIQGRGIAYELSANRYWQIKGHHYLAFRAMTYGHHYNNNRFYSEDHGTSQAGYSYQSANNIFNLLAIGELHRQDAATDYRNYGLRGEWTRNFLPRASLGLQLEHKLRRHTSTSKADILDSRTSSIVLQGNYLLTPKSIAFAGIDYTRLKAKNSPSDSYQQRGISIGINQQISRHLNATLIGMHRSRHYDDQFIGYDHNDRERIYMLVIKADTIDIGGFKPVLSLKKTSVKSSIDWLINYQQNEISLQLEKIF